MAPPRGNGTVRAMRPCPPVTPVGRSWVEALGRAGAGHPELVAGVWPAAVGLSAEEAAEAAGVATAVSGAVIAGALSWSHDAGLQALVPLPDEVGAHLERLGPLGRALVRPDFIVDLDGRPRICEVNARFPLNGTILLGWLSELLGAAGFAPPPGVGALGSAVGEGLGAGPVLVVQGEERGNDLALLVTHPQLSLRSGEPPVQISVLDLAGVAPQLRPEALRRRLGAEPAPVVWLELHHHELCDLLGPLVEFQLGGGVVLNDPRVVLVGHDKRLLAACAGAGAAQTFASGAVPDEVICEPGAWVAKPARSGKCDGVAFGATTTQARWRALVSGPGWAVQRVVRSAEVALPGSRGRWQLVGTLPCDGARSFGPGMYRAFPAPFRAESWLLAPILEVAGVGR